MSYAYASCAAEWKVPSQIFLWVLWSVISATHVPHARWRTPWYFRCGGRSGYRKEDAPPRDGCARPRFALRIGGGDRRQEDPAICDAGVKLRWQ